MKTHFKTGLLSIFFLLCPPWICMAENKNRLPSKPAIQQTLQLVADWQIANFSYITKGSAFQLHDYGIDAWTNGVFFLGLAEWSYTIENPESYRSWLMETGKKTDWQLARNFIYYPQYGIYHADELCIGQFYLSMYDLYKDPDILTDTQNRINSIIVYPPREDVSHKNKQRWTWCDALFMAPPVYARMSRITGDEKYVDFMNKEFHSTYDHLYSKADSLFFRDDSYFNQTEENGQPVFWGRGNGWVAAGLVNILKYLSPDSAYRSFYEELFRELCTKLASLQSEQGFWHASLLDPDTYPAPETSATAFIVYAFAYGINEGLLDEKAFLPVVMKSWNALSGVVDSNGKLGWVQPIGANPKAVTKDMTAVYGPGGYLLAGTEMIRLIENK